MTCKELKELIEKGAYFQVTDNYLYIGNDSSLKLKINNEVAIPSLLEVKLQLNSHLCDILKGLTSTTNGIDKVCGNTPIKQIIITTVPKNLDVDITIQLDAPRHGLEISRFIRAPELYERVYDMTK